MLADAGSDRTSTAGADLSLREEREEIQQFEQFERFEQWRELLASKSRKVQDFAAAAATTTNASVEAASTAGGEAQHSVPATMASVEAASMAGGVEAHQSAPATMATKGGGSRVLKIFCVAAVAVYFLWCALPALASFGRGLETFEEATLTRSATVALATNGVDFGAGALFT
jgi:hypothetical protein